MELKDNIIMDDISYLILNHEDEYIFHPEMFHIQPIWTKDERFHYTCTYHLKDFQLYIQSFTVTADCKFPIINGVNPSICSSDQDLETVYYDNIMEPLFYTGSLLIGHSFIKNYGLSDTSIPIYSYQVVREVMIKNGKLVTTIDHSKAMLRIRKNIDLGLRRIDKKRDLKCINHFIKTSVVGDYKSNKTNKGYTMVKEVQKPYELKFLKEVKKRIRKNL